MPDAISSEDSPWYGYLRAVYGEALVLPYDMRKLRFVYQNSASWRKRYGDVDWPVAACAAPLRGTLTMKSIEEEDRLTEAEQPERCTNCRRWLDTRSPHHANGPRRHRAMHTANDRVALTVGYELYLDATGNGSLGLRWWQRDDILRHQDGAWLEVIRHRAAFEGFPGVGTWFNPAAGSDIWLNVGTTLRLPTKDADEALKRRWLLSRNATGRRVARGFAWQMIAVERDFRISASHGNFLTVLSYELNFDTLQLDHGAARAHPRMRLSGPELVVTSAATLLHPRCTCPGCSRRERLRRCPRSGTAGVCGQNITLRTHMAREPCVCSEHSTGPMLNCDGS